MGILSRLWRYGPLALALAFAAALAVALAPRPAPAQALLNQLVAPPEAAGAATPTTLTAEQTLLLIDLLRDEAARAALIAELERLAAERAAAAPAAEQAAAAPGAAAAVAADAGAPEAAAGQAAPAERLALGREIARRTQEIAQGAVANAAAFWDRLTAAPAIFSGLADIDTDFLLDALVQLALVIATTVGLFVVLRTLARRLYARMGDKARPMGFFGTALVYLASIAVDATVVLAAWAGGYVLALTVFGEFGSIAIRQTLYLNAFLMVEMVKVGIRAVLSPASHELRPVRVPDRGARLTYRTLDIVVSIIGYGQFLIVPIAKENIGYYPSRSVSALLLLVALAILVFAVLRNRRAVADWLYSGRENGRDGGRDGATPRGRIWRGLTRIWHVPVLLYLATIFLIVVTRPGDVLLPLLAASGKILLAAAIGWAVAGLIGRAIARGIGLPTAVNRRLPLLERRLNAFVPRILLVLRIVILLAVIAYTLHVAGLFDFALWLDGPIGAWLTTTAAAVVLILLLSFAVWLALSSWVDYRLNPDFGKVPTSREQTLLTLLRNAATIALIAITLMFVLSEIGLDIAPLLASAGILGLAIGFGAQKMVEDIITGVFIQLENAIHVGDVVTAGGISGNVERLTIRSVSLRDLNGVFHIIPFSSVDVVSNYMREFAFAVADIGIGYRVDVEVARQAMHDAFEELRADPAQAPGIIGDLEWFGVQQLGDSAVILRARIKTLPGKQWGVGRAYNGIIKRIFDARGIDMPFPTQTIHLGGAHGEAPVAVRSIPAADATARTTDAPASPGGASRGMASDGGIPPTDESDGGDGPR